jgi:type III secretion protein Q
MSAGMRTEIRCTRPDNWMPLRRLGTRRLTRAHLALARRPHLGAMAAAGLERVAAALSAQLGCDIRLAGLPGEHVAIPANDLGALSVFALLELTAGAKAVLEVELPDAVALVGRLCGARASTGPVLELTRLEEGAFGFLNLVALGALRSDPAFDALWRPRLITVQGDRAILARDVGSSPHVTFDVRFDLEGLGGKARLYLPADALLLMLATVPESASATLSESVGQAEIAVTCRAGHCELEPQVLRELVPGDVVLFEGARFEGGQLVGPARILSATFELAGEFDAQGFHPTRGQGRAHPLEPSMSQDASSHLPVDLEVELTRVSLAISELSALEPGSVLPLHMSVSKPVLLRVGDRVVAKAELVDVEGEIGARILSLLP